MLSNKETSGTIDFTLSSLKPFQGKETVQEGLGRACFFPRFPSLSSFSFTIIHPTSAGRQSRKVTEPCLLLSPATGKGHTGAGHPDTLKAHRRQLKINILHGDQVGPTPGEARALSGQLLPWYLLFLCQVIGPSLQFDFQFFVSSQVQTLIWGNKLN